jgi:hypothetical protein
LYKVFASISKGMLWIFFATELTITKVPKESGGIDGGIGYQDGITL